LNSEDLATMYLVESGTGTTTKSRTVFPIPTCLAGATFTIGIWLKALELAEGNGTEKKFQLIFTDKTFAANFTTINVTFPPISDYTLVRATHTFSTGFVDSGFGITLKYLSGAQGSGDRLGFWRAHAFLGSEDDIQIEPEYDYVQRDDKIQDMHVTRDGGQFAYKWGDRFRVKFGQKLVDSHTQAWVNCWWNENEKLLWVVDCGERVESVQITNKNFPIGKFVLPHDTLYMGAIELETY
ncbi:hypothetical protein LCGC14_1812840, partial [marine sediment metagenome]